MFIYGEIFWLDTITVHLTNVVSIMQERMQRLCQEIEKHVKLGKTIKEKMPTCKITEVKTKLIEVMRIMLDNRLEFNKEYFPQCGKRMQECFLLWKYSFLLHVVV